MLSAIDAVGAPTVVFSIVLITISVVFPRDKASDRKGETISGRPQHGGFPLIIGRSWWTRSADAWGQELP